MIVRELKCCKLIVYNKSVEQIMIFKYLGVNIISIRNLKEEVQAQTIKAANVWLFTRYNLKTQIYELKEQDRIYKTYMKLIMICNSVLKQE